MKGYLPPQNTQEEIFCRQVRDAAVRSERISRPVYIGFLDERQQQLASTQLAGSKWSQHLFFGGCSSAERKVLCVYTEDLPQENDFPISALRISCTKESFGSLTHRDYLGALLALGLERRCIGDIFPDELGAVAFVQTEQAQLIRNELHSVGRFFASAQPCEELPANLCSHPAEVCTVNVASLRLDAVLAAALHLSRANAAALVASGKVLVCHVAIQDSSRVLSEGDTVTVRGLGRFSLTSVGGRSKKDRIFLTLTKY